jgi:glycosyltransferase involved in cell wall biosynthesis
MTNGSCALGWQDTSQRPLRVALDVGFLELPPSGVGAYVQGLLGALQRRDDVEIQQLRPPAALGRLGPRAMRMVWDAAGVEVVRAIGARDADLLHIPAFSAPAVSPAPKVVTVHDVIPLVLPDYRASRAMSLYLALMRRTVHRARIVLTPSAFSAAEITRVLGIAPERVRVTPLAVDPSLRPAPDIGQVRARVAQRFGVDGPYLLHMAGFDRRKNVRLLVRALARALPELPDDASLVLAGAPHSDNSTVFPPVEPLIEALGVGERILLTGRVSNEERALLYQGALGYVTLSSYEGFGLTPLEAMTCGVPVIAANRTSLPEVVGDAGMLVEPDVDEGAAAIVALVTNDAIREDLARRGLERAAGFTWDRTADLTVAAYREAIPARR